MNLNKLIDVNVLLFLPSVTIHKDKTISFLLDETPKRP